MRLLVNTKNSNPLVSIITPSFNSERFIIETYESICSQSYGNWEWLITDDCSIDQTLSIIKIISLNDERVKVYSNFVNSGAAVSRNNSISNSKGDYLAFIDSDDLWYAGKLEMQLDFMQQNDIELCFTAYEVITEDGRSTGKVVDSLQNTPLTYRDMLRKKATHGCSTVMLKKDSFNDVQMPLLRTGQDYALWLKLLRTNINTVPLPRVLTKYRICSNSISRNKFKKARRQWQIYREVESLSLLKSLEFFCFYAFRAVFKR